MKDTFSDVLNGSKLEDEKTKDIDRIFREGVAFLSPSYYSSLPVNLEEGIEILLEYGLCYSESFNEKITIGRNTQIEDREFSLYIGSIMLGLICVDICPYCKSIDTLLEGPSGGLAVSIKCSECETKYYVGLYCCVTEKTFEESE